MAYGVHKVVSFVSSGLWDGCQWLLTVGMEACGGVLDGGEGGVHLQEVGDDLCALRLQLVARQTANERQIGVSAAADSGNRHEVAYLSVWRVSFALSASETCFAPSAWM